MVRTQKWNTGTGRWNKEAVRRGETQTQAVVERSGIGRLGRGAPKNWRNVSCQPTVNHLNTNKLFREASLKAKHFHSWPNQIKLVGIKQSLVFFGQTGLATYSTTNGVAALRLFLSAEQGGENNRDINDSIHIPMFLSAPSFTRLGFQFYKKWCCSNGFPYWDNVWLWWSLQLQKRFFLIRFDLSLTLMSLQLENENNGTKIVCNIFCFSFTSIIVADASKKFCKFILIQLDSQIFLFCSD